MIGWIIMHDLDVLKKLNARTATPYTGKDTPDPHKGETPEEFKKRIGYPTPEKPTKLKEAPAFDAANPAKTLAALAKIDEATAQKFLSDLPLTDYIAVANAMENKDIAKISAIVGKHKLKEAEYHEAIDLKVANELRKISQQSPHQNTAVNTTTNAMNTPTPNAAAQSTAPSATTAGTLGMTGTISPVGTVGSVGTVGTTPPTAANPGTPSTPGLAANNILSADSKTGTIAMKNPQTKKVEIKNVKDPKQSAEIMALIKNIGL
jgi:hypothetical protein